MHKLGAVEPPPASHPFASFIRQKFDRQYDMLSRFSWTIEGECEMDFQGEKDVVWYMRGEGGYGLP